MLSENLLTLRKLKQLTQEAVAEKVGVSTSTAKIVVDKLMIPEYNSSMLN